MRPQVSSGTRDDLLESFSEEYGTADRIRKTAILDLIQDVSNLHRKSLIRRFTSQKKQAEASAQRRRRGPKLGSEAFEALLQCWNISDQICGKRLAPMLPELVENLIKWGNLSLSEEALAQLLSVSAATIDRALKQERGKLPRSLSHTKRASLVKSKVPIKTFGDWKDVEPGFFEIDTVAHSSSDPNGPFLSTLNMTDLATCWTVPIAIFDKSANAVTNALSKATELIPFPLRGLDFDNGSEFLNEDVLAWCDHRKISYSRSRPYKKNDQAWIEEKNRSVVRRAVGRDRYQGIKTLDTLTQLYCQLALYYNFFQPVQKLVRKERNGAKVYKVHDVAKAPYQRVLDHPQISESYKTALRKTRDGLSVVQLKHRITQLQLRLNDQAVPITDPATAIIRAQRNAVHKFVVKNTDNNHTEAAPLSKQKRTIAATEIRHLLKNLTPGTLFKISDLIHLGSRTSVDQAIRKLTKKEVINKVGHGTYQIPELHTQNTTLSMHALGNTLNEATV